MFTVLLVGDQPMNRKLFRGVLERQFAVVEAGSVEDALEHLKTLQPDLILLDILSPGMDGLSLVRRLKARPATADIPVVGVSAHALPRDAEQARAAGCVDFITRPVADDPFGFLERLARWVRSRSGPDVPALDNPPEG
jgi:putative two-component system response regulator